jgi:glycosyltransferase involved in cell wall biosynthesis
MTKLEVPAGVWWELLVVNNNCTDATDDVIASFAERLPIRRLWQPVPGVANARQMAVDEAAGEYILWTDDDVLVPPTWMVEYLRAFERWPDAAIFGGPIRPWFPTEAPRWLDDAWPLVANAYASIDYSEEPVPLGGVRVPFTANAAMRTSVHRDFPFDAALGVRPGGRMGGEETDVVRRALAAGHTGWWVPTAHVRHYIPLERQTLKYVRGWYYAYGQYLSLADAATSQPVLFGRPRYLWKQAITAELRYHVRRRLCAPRLWVDDLVLASTAGGQLRGLAGANAERAP